MEANTNEEQCYLPILLSGAADSSVGTLALASVSEMAGDGSWMGSETLSELVARGEEGIASIAGATVLDESTTSFSGVDIGGVVSADAAFMASGKEQRDQWVTFTNNKNHQLTGQGGGSRLCL